MIKISRSNRRKVCCACSLHVSVLGSQEAVRMDTPQTNRSVGVEF
jgi:hypothetical protein